ncbi:MAG TPA: sugar transferase [Kribbella sp.]|jgi:lipopolysaccharide/colanic/teichoic acid biosynthesis glycosyltransferase
MPIVEGDFDEGRRVAQAAKRKTMDVAASAIALALLSPIVGGVTALVRWRLGMPAIYRQERQGLDGRLFTICKFRTMSNDRDSNGELLSDAERLTPLGRALRATSIDELPELWNVLKGDMSLVGPKAAVDPLHRLHD